MFVVVLASQKGGAGKTTLCGHLAVEAERTGAGPVAVIDTDPQASLAMWHDERTAKGPHLVRLELSGLATSLAQLRDQGYRLVFIDTPPANTNSISEVIGHADLVVIPTRPSPHDLRAVGATVDMADGHRKSLLFVVNGATPRARITAEAAVALSQHGVVAPVMLHHRIDFAASMTDGRTAGEVNPKSISAREVSELWTYIHNRLARPNGKQASEEPKPAQPMAEETELRVVNHPGSDDAEAPEAVVTDTGQSPPEAFVRGTELLPRQTGLIVPEQKLLPRRIAATCIDQSPPDFTTHAEQLPPQDAVTFTEQSPPEAFDAQQLRPQQQLPLEAFISAPEHLPPEPFLGGAEQSPPQPVLTEAGQSPPQQPLFSFGRTPRMSANALFHYTGRALHPFGRRHNGS